MVLLLFPMKLIENNTNRTSKKKTAISIHNLRDGVLRICKSIVEFIVDYEQIAVYSFVYSFFINCIAEFYSKKVDLYLP